MKQLKTVLAGSALAAAVCVGLPSVAQAEVITLAPHVESITTADGWTVTVSLIDEEWNKVPATNMTGTSREGYGSLRAVVDVSGEGDSPLKGTQMSVGYIVGCFANLNSITPGIQVDVGPAVGVDVGIQGGVLGVLAGPSANLHAGLGAVVSPSIYASFSPGQIQPFALAAKDLEETEGIVQIRNAHMHLDGCVGPVQVRAFASVTIDSKRVKDSAVVYGDTFPI